MISHDRRYTLVLELTELTERQIDAARTLDNETMQHLNELRSDHLFNLQVALQDTTPMSTEDKRLLMEAAQKLQSTEERLTRITELVLQIFEQMTPYTPARTLQRLGITVVLWTKSLRIRLARDDSTMATGPVFRQLDAAQTTC